MDVCGATTEAVGDLDAGATQPGEVADDIVREPTLGFVARSDQHDPHSSTVRKPAAGARRGAQ